MDLNIKKIAPFLSVAVFFVVIDRFLKVLALNYFQFKNFELFGEYFKFSFAKNYYIAFSLPLGGLFLNILIPAVIIIILYSIINLSKKRQYIKSGLLTILAFGAISNYIDRLKYGFVVDYLDLKYFTVFNIADSMIVISVFVLIIYCYHKNEF